MHRTLVPAFGLALALAVSPARADDASRLKLARDVVEVARAGDHMKALMPTFLGQMKGIIQTQGNMDAAQADAFLARVQKRFEDGIPAFTTLVAEVYAREFSEDDLRNLLSFYRTPAGQHLLDKQVPIAQGMAQVGAKWGQSIAQEVLAEQAKEHAKDSAPKL